jgi:16S rRNA (uracil1498-N3)-methyltransferase
MPGSIRLYVTAALTAGAELEASPGQAHYLAVVMRCAIGGTVRVFNGTDGEWQARITRLRRDAVRLAVERQTRPQAAEPDVWLAFALLKRDATDLVVQKATELGAAALLPVLTARVNAARVNLARLAAIATEAAEQSERLAVPRISPPQRLSALLAAWPPDRPLVVAVEREAAPPVAPERGPVGLLIGPEGGFTRAELDELRRHAFVKTASLGPRILRAETAAIVGLALLQAPGGG